MEGESQDQTGNLYSPRPLVFGPGKIRKIMGHHDVFLGGGFIVTPPEGLTFPASDKETAGSPHGVVGLVTVEAIPSRENLEVPLAYVLKNT